MLTFSCLVASVSGASKPPEKQTDLCASRWSAGKKVQFFSAVCGLRGPGRQVALGKNLSECPSCWEVCRNAGRTMDRKIELSGQDTSRCAQENLAGRWLGGETGYFLGECNFNAFEFVKTVKLLVMLVLYLWCLYLCYLLTWKPSDELFQLPPPKRERLYLKKCFCVKLTSVNCAG